MKKILGLDVGTNSIGGALVNVSDDFGREGNIEWIGSRILPMEQNVISQFADGVTESNAAERRLERSARRLNQRYKLRRERLVTVMGAVDWLNADEVIEHYKKKRNFRLSDYLTIDVSTLNEAAQELGIKNKLGTLAMPEDWVVYYLRKKALSEIISLKELARIIYMMNQRRGFKSSRKEQLKDDGESKRSWIEKLTFTSVIELPKEEKKKYNKYQIIAGQYSWEKEAKRKPDWEGQTRFVKITETTRVDKRLDYSFDVPKDDDYLMMVAALKKDIVENENQQVGEYFFHQLKRDPNYRIRQRIIERSLYKKEIETIWAKQLELNPDLRALNERYNSNQGGLKDKVIHSLYKHNKDKFKELSGKDLLHVIANDIIYYQRDLKSQKGSVEECRLERSMGIDGREHGLKVAPRSCPEFQEYRIWQQVHNLRIVQREMRNENKLKFDVDVTDSLLDKATWTKIKADLFVVFDEHEKVSESAIFKVIIDHTKDKSINDKTYKINLFYRRTKEGKSDMTLLGNETKAGFRKFFTKHNFDGSLILSDEKEFHKLWHMFYSLKEEELYTAKEDGSFQCPKALLEWGFSEEMIKHLSRSPEMNKQYTSLSTKAIKKFLTLMRCNEKYSLSLVPEVAVHRIEAAIGNHFEEDLDEKIQAKILSLNYTDIDDFKGSPVWLASYLIYGIHSERMNTDKYEKFDEIDVEKLIPHNSLRNPIVEKVLKETLKVVKDVWEQYGRPDEIHIELGRELKKTAQEKKDAVEGISSNEKERKRVRELLKEMQLGSYESPTHIEKFRIWKNTGGRAAQFRFHEIFKGKNDDIQQDKLNEYKRDYWSEVIEPSKGDITKYQLWLEQNHVSPYTGKMIPLSKLYTPAYEIEHIFPKSRFFDDSMANKTICERAINKHKENMTAMQMFQQDGGRTIDGYTLLTLEEYEAHVKRTFYGKKQRNLLSEEIPEEFVSRQLTDTRYIAKKLNELLFPICKDKEGLVFTIGSITSELKENWGLHRAWKEILKPRFERLEKMTGEKLIDFDNATNDIRFKKDYKRIDHRHHALDALVIACTSRSHIKYLNSLNSHDEKLKHKYLTKESTRKFHLPWPTFTKEAKEKLDQVIVSHKSTNRIIKGKPLNKYTKYVQQADGSWKKEVVKQQPSNNPEKQPWIGVRKSLFKEPLGVINLREYKEVASVRDVVKLQLEAMQSDNKMMSNQIADKKLRKQVEELIKNCQFDLDEVMKFLKKNPLLDANREPLKRIKIIEWNKYAGKRVSFNKDMDEAWINKNIPYANNHPKQWLAMLMKEHLASKDGNSTEAFIGEGLDELNKKYARLVKKEGAEIKKISRYEIIGTKIEMEGKFLEMGDTNPLFVIAINNETGEREYDSPPLIGSSTSEYKGIIHQLANRLPLVDEKSECRYIYLTPYDLVYVPNEDELLHPELITIEDVKRQQERIYKMVSSTKKQCFFVPHYVASVLQDKVEFESMNKSEKTIDGSQSVKKVCIKLTVDRLGNIKGIASR